MSSITLVEFQPDSLARRRRLIVGLLLAALIAGITSVKTVQAQTADSNWPAYQLHPQGNDSHQIERGPGRYLSTGKIVFCWLLLAAWVATTDWVSRDCQTVGQNHVLWNPVLCGSFALAYLLVWMIPVFVLGVILLLLGYFGPLVTYVVLRNQAVQPHQRVFTPDHLRHVLAERLGRVGIKVAAEKQASYDQGAPVEFKPRGGASEQENQANLILARQSPGFVSAKELVADLIGRRGEAAVLDYSSSNVAVQYQIDGVMHAVESLERETGDPLLAVFKKLAALNPDERQAKQAGQILAEYQGQTHALRILSQGTQTGERVILRPIPQAVQFKTLEALGMRPKLREALLEQLNSPGGIVLFCSLPGGGLTSTVDAALLNADRLVRGFVAVEDLARREHELENVEVTTYHAAAGESPATVLPKLIRAYPDVFVVRDLVNAETVDILCDQATSEQRMVVATVRAKEAVEALLRVLMMKTPAKKFAPAVKAVVNQRLIRRLCPDCKIGYQPTPEVLKKLGLPAGKVAALYREPKPEEIEKPCLKCQGVGYLGRTSIFEVLLVNDQIRQALVQKPELPTLRAAAKAAGAHTLQGEGILLVAKGETSIVELMRVLKT